MDEQLNTSIEKLDEQIDTTVESYDSDIPSTVSTSLYTIGRHLDDLRFQKNQMQAQIEEIAEAIGRIEKFLEMSPSNFTNSRNI